VATSRSTARITSGAYHLDVAIVAFRQEQAWTGRWAGLGFRVSSQTGCHRLNFNVIAMS
jgi:hypothetical protein